MPLKENKMSLDAKLRKIANTARGKKGTYSLNLMHADNCLAVSSGNLLACNCDFQVEVLTARSFHSNAENSEKTVSAEKQKVSNKLAKRINEKSKKDIRH